MLSRGQWEGLRCWIISVRTERDTCSKLSKTAGQIGETTGSDADSITEDLISEILSIKKDFRKSSHSLGEGTVTL